MGPQNNMRIMTYNLHGCIGTDGCYDPEHILRVIQETTPDILGMQEVRRNTGTGCELLDLLQSAFPDYHLIFGKTLKDTRGDFGNALLSRYPVAEYLDVDLEEIAGYSGRLIRPEARRAIFARLDIGFVRLWVVVTHLDLRKRVRRGQGKLLVEAILRYTNPSEKGVVFMGDLNEWRLPNAFLRHLDKLFSRHTIRRSFPSRFPLLPLDRIWMSSRLKQHQIKAHRSRLSRRASDHLPLYADVSL